MIDERELQELPGDEAVDQGVGTEPTSPPTSPVAPERQPEARPSKINLDELPEFRNFKSEQDKRFAAMEKAHREQLAAEAQRRQWYEQQLEQTQTSGMSEMEKLQYQNQKLQRQLQEREQRIQQEEINRARYTALQTISEATGAPMDLLWQAEDPNEAWKLGATYLKTQAAAPVIQQQQQEKRERNAVDTGAGASITANDWDATADKLLKQKNSQGYIKHLLAGRT